MGYGTLHVKADAEQVHGKAPEPREVKARLVSATSPSRGPGFGMPEQMSLMRLALIAFLVVVALPFCLIQLWQGVVESRLLLGVWTQPIFLVIAFYSAIYTIKLWHRGGQPARVKHLALSANLPWALWYTPIVFLAILTIYMVLGAL